MAAAGLAGAEVEGLGAAVVGAEVVAGDVEVAGLAVVDAGGAEEGEELVQAGRISRLITRRETRITRYLFMTMPPLF